MSDQITFNLEDFDLDGEFESKEEALEAFHGKFIAKELAPNDKDLRKKIAGNLLGSISTHAKREFGFENSDIDGLKLEEIITKGVNHIRENATGSGEDVEQAVAEWREKYQQKDSEVMDWKNKYETDIAETESKWKGELTNYQIAQKRNEILKSIPLKEMRPIERTGFETQMNSVEWKMSESGDVIPTRDGEPLKNEKGTAFMSAQDYILSIAKENDLLKKAENNDKKNSYFQNREKPSGGEDKKTKVHPRLQKWASK